MTCPWVDTDDLFKSMGEPSYKEPRGKIYEEQLEQKGKSNEEQTLPEKSNEDAYEKGYKDGYEEGYGDGYDSGYDHGFDGGVDYSKETNVYENCIDSSLSSDPEDGQGSDLGDDCIDSGYSSSENYGDDGGWSESDSE